MHIIQNLKLKNKLLLSFFAVTFISIFVTTFFFIYYFSNKQKQEATVNMQKNIEIASLMLSNKQKETDVFAKTLSNDKAMQILLDLKYSSKLSEYLKGIIIREKIYDIFVADNKGSIVSAAGDGSREYMKAMSPEILPEKTSIQKAINGEYFSTGELFTSKSGIKYLSLSAYAPVVRNGTNVGVIIVRYVLNGRNDFPENIKKLLGVNCQIFVGTNPVSYTAIDHISDDIYQKIKEHDKYEVVNISFGGKLAEYRSIKDYKDNKIGIIGITLSSHDYAMSLLNSIIVILVIMIICLISATVLGFFISNSILIPIQQLLTGVNKITSGDLSYEIMIDIKDEIGKLSESFNIMRISLNDKINTIETLNQGLEKKVKERTGTIESLLNKMRKYLSPQLYDSIIGGKQDTEGKAHSRKKLTIFFSDIVGFTQTTDSLEAEDLSDILNSYLDNMAKIALKWGGTIDKFIGDAIMVFFGDPEFINDKEHASRAVRMAIEMREKLEELRGEWVEKGFEHPLHVRMGINTGYCTVGNFGSENRMDYTIIGGNVNLTSRLQTAAEPDTIYISHETYSLIKDEISCEYIGEITVKGFRDAIKSYKVIKPKTAQSPQYIKLNTGELTFAKSRIDITSLNDEDKNNLVQSLKKALIYLEKASQKK